MSSATTVRIILPDDGLRESAKAGDHNFFRLMSDVLTKAGLSVQFAASSAGIGDDFSVFHMEQPLPENSVTVRRNYFYPFWQIEQTAGRWQWDVARAQFDADAVDRVTAKQFFKFWQKRLYGDAAARATRERVIYVPLQGRLLDHRSFQHCAPIDMLKSVIARYSDRTIVAGLHPGETYEASEIAALERLEAAHPFLEVHLGQMERWLAICELIVTQNSAAAFSGLFFNKPSVLFARIDFHHVMASVGSLGVEGAFDAADNSQVDPAQYVWWFLQKMSINAGRPEAPARIAARFRALGWPV